MFADKIGIKIEQPWTTQISHGKDLVVVVVVIIISS